MTEKYVATMTVSDEAIVDYSLGTHEDQVAAAARLDARYAEALARWNALSLQTRITRRHVYPRYHGARERLAHAYRALRGIECERD